MRDDLLHFTFYSFKDLRDQRNFSVVPLFVEEDGSLRVQFSAPHAPPGEVTVSSLVQTESERATIELKNVRPNTKYEIAVQAFNSEGTGPSTPALLASTLEGS